jgi:hypothetical protein
VPDKDASVESIDRQIKLALLLEPKLDLERMVDRVGRCRHHQSVYPET